MKSLVLDDIWIVLDYKYHRIFFVEEANKPFLASNFNFFFNLMFSPNKNGAF